MNYKLLLYLLLVNAHVYGVTSKEVRISLDMKDFFLNWNNENVYITTSKYLCSYSGNTHEPALPLIAVNILIGKNDVYDNFSDSIDEQEIAKNIRIVNNMEEIPTGTIGYLSESISSDYSRDSYPDEIIKYVGTHEVDGYRYVSFLISPFRYNNINKTLFFEKNILICLNTHEINRTRGKVDLQCRASQDRIRDLVVNKEDISLLYPMDETCQPQSGRTITQYDYIIITNNSLKQTFMRLADWKMKKGIRTTVLTTEEIYSNYSGNTNQQKIKTALKYYYDNCSKLKYALLGGDVDVVPTQMCVVKYLPNSNTRYVKNCPVDLFYADFLTMDWDGNGNGIYGETNEVSSPNPQIAITRAPVSSVIDAENFVNRIIEYESNPNVEDWANNILMCGSKLGNYYEYNGVTMSDTHYKGERFYTENIAPYWIGNKISFFDTGTDFPDGADYDFVPQNIQKELSKGYTFINIDTHGSPSSWATEGYEYLVPYADTLNNTNQSIIITTACLTNAFDSISKCLSEAFVRNQNSGIVSYFGCSRYGWYNNSQYTQGTSSKVNAELYKILFGGNVKNFGEVVRYTKENILPFCGTYDTPYRWLLFGLNPLGDPEMPIFTSIPQKFSNVSISFSNGILNVNTGVSDCKICVLSANDMGSAYHEVKFGMSASFANLVDEYSICITKMGYVPYVAKCGSTVYLQDETINRDYEVFSNTTSAGSNVTTNKPNGPVEINKGKTIIRATNGVTINDSFVVKNGASLEIRTN